jgi:hypothetical protein
VRLANQKRLEIPTEIDRERRCLRRISIFLQESQAGQDDEVKDLAGRLLSVLTNRFKLAKSIYG